VSLSARTAVQSMWSTDSHKSSRRACRELPQCTPSTAACGLHGLDYTYAHTMCNTDDSHRASCDVGRDVRCYHRSTVAVHRSESLSTHVQCDDQQWQCIGVNH